MLRALSLALTVAALLTTAPRGQTTGVPFANDLRIMVPPLMMPQGSGATSCTPASNIGFVPGAPFVVAYDVTAVGSTAAFLLLDFFSPCNSPGFGFFPAQPVTCAGPVAGGTNLWYALGFSPAPVAVATPMNAAGMGRWNFNVPAGPGQVWTQCVLLDTCSSYGFKFTQALGFSW